MKTVLLLVLLASVHALPPPDATPPQVEPRSRFAALDDVHLLANGLLQLGLSLKDFVQKTKGQISDIFQKLNIFDKSFSELSMLATEIKEDEEELKKTTVVLKASNDEMKSLSQQINSKVEDIMQERSLLKSQVGGLEERLSGMSKILHNPEQAVEMSTLKEVIQAQERSIADLLISVREQSEQLKQQRNKIKNLETKLSSDNLQDTTDKFDRSSYNLSGYLHNYSSEGSFSSDLPMDCGEVFRRGKTASGLYPIKPNQSEPFVVSCEITDDGVFTVIQRRQDGSVDFNQTWENYEDGFGDFRGEFWLGLKKIHSISRLGSSHLRIQFGGWGHENYLLEYQYILEGPASNYTIHLKQESGELINFMTSQAKMRFSTRDRNSFASDSDCDQDRIGGWWISDCRDINLNGGAIQSRRHDRQKSRKGHPWRPNTMTNMSPLKSTKISIRHLTDKPSP